MVDTVDNIGRTSNYLAGSREAPEFVPRVGVRVTAQLGCFLLAVARSFLHV